MKTVLIADDEKFIRKGIAVMLQRSPVPVEEILEARDGEEALERLSRQAVDLVITDIRMPRLDGIALAKKCKEMTPAPMVIVISGFDDFNYALQMLRNGVQDYLLKPVERTALYQALEKVESRLQGQHQQRSSQKESLRLALHYVMHCADPADPRRMKLMEEYGNFFFPDAYHVVCTKEILRGMHRGLQVADGGERNCCIVPQKEWTQMSQNMEHSGSILGISRLQQGMEQLCTAYQESIYEWKKAFVSAGASTQADDREKNITASHLTQLISLSKWSEALALLRGQCELVRADKMAPETVGTLCHQFVEEILRTYPDLSADGEIYKNLWEFENAEEYLCSISRWLEQLTVSIEKKYCDYAHRQKIAQAEAYIRKNFRKPINMTMVSNQVSMNYTLFSIVFKQYTGKNFVSYLQSVRIDEAKRLLTDTQWKVYEISTYCGFQDDKHFLKVFKSATGVSPGEWRGKTKGSSGQMPDSNKK